MATVTQRLSDAGFAIAKAQHAIGRDGDRYFGTIDLVSELVPGVSVAVGLRNSVDKSFPFGFIAGTRVFVCSNLAFNAELEVTRKHTKFGNERFVEAICGAINQLQVFREQEAARITRLQSSEIKVVEAESLILRSFEKGIVNVHDLPRILGEYRKPSYQEFEAPTRWNLFQAFTEILGKKPKLNPRAYAETTIALQGLIGGEASKVSASVGAEVPAANAV